MMRPKTSPPASTQPEYTGSVLTSTRALSHSERAALFHSKRASGRPSPVPAGAREEHMFSKSLIGALILIGFIALMVGCVYAVGFAIEDIRAGMAVTS